MARPGVPPSFPLFPLLRSELQARILARALLGDREESAAELASAINADPDIVAREVARMARAGLLTTRRVGRTKVKVVGANTAGFYQPLLDLVTIVLSPATVLAEQLAELAGIRSAEIIGSWAARYYGEPGPLPTDIDLLVVGNPDRDELNGAAQEATRRLRRAVNPVVISEDRWRTGVDSFMIELRARRRVPVIHPRET